MINNLLRPYLVIPKLIEQPTWGGTYITEAKNWSKTEGLVDKKIGQSYELYDKSNLSLATSSRDAMFVGELATNKSVYEQSTYPGSRPLNSLIEADARAILGDKNIETYGPWMHLLLKFTQALGNSFQLHIPDGVQDSHWKPKPESWYYFEPGLMTCGVRGDASWIEYEKSVRELDAKTKHIASQVADKSLSYDSAKEQIAKLITIYNPWQFVNQVRVEPGTLLDLSPCGIHHSWEEDLMTIPLGNVLYEIQLNVMDDVATLRSFDKGKMSKDGTLRELTIDDYFKFADRSVAANDPQTHMRKAKALDISDRYAYERILTTKYYTMDRLVIGQAPATFTESIETFRHVFLRSGMAKVSAGDTSVEITSGHSVFVPAGCKSYTIEGAPTSEILISY